MFLGGPLMSVAFANEGQTALEVGPGSAAAATTAPPIVFDGYVLDPRGEPAEGALVVSSAGGKAVVDAAGFYSLETRVPRDADRVQLTAVARGNEPLSASTSVEPFRSSGRVSVGTLVLSQGVNCRPRWLPTFGGAPGMDRPINALAVFDDGDGLALYAAGDFEQAGGLPVNMIAKWDGSNWSRLGGGLSGGNVNALAAHDDGGGEALYAAGTFTSADGTAVNRIARWDGSNWSAVGSGLDSTVFALAVYNDGGGEELYAGGSFLNAGGGPANRLAKWDGAGWSALGSGADAPVNALIVHDDGGGSALYAGGNFSDAGGTAASHIAKWDGASWSALGSGLDDRAYSLGVYDDGGGAALYVGGDFVNAGGVAASHIAKWDGTNWSALGAGISNRVQSMAVYDGGGGAELYVGGIFTMADGAPANKIARWNGASWSPVGSGLDNSGPSALLTFDPGGGTVLFAAGNSTVAGGAVARRIASWDGTNWSALGHGLFDDVEALIAFDDGSGDALYAAGDFVTAGGVAVNRIAEWDGTNWSALGGGLEFGRVRALAVFDDGLGDALYAAGSFTHAGGAGVGRIAKWDGSAWSGLGSGIDSESVYALQVYDDGGGDALYVGGSFSNAGGVAASRIARWDGSNWSALGTGMAGGDVLALAVYDDGGGAALYAGGSFTDAGGAAAARMAEWNGVSWSPLGTGVNDTVQALTLFDLGGGTRLYAAGRFTTAGGVNARRIARWNGSTWQSLNNNSGPGFTARALAVYDDGGGDALYIAGDFTSAGGNAANRLVKWDGTNWTALGRGTNASVHALAVYGDSLYAGGLFWTVYDSGDSFLGRWKCVPPSSRAEEPNQ